MLQTTSLQPAPSATTQGIKQRNRLNQVCISIEFNPVSHMAIGYKSQPLCDKTSQTNSKVVGPDFYLTTK